MSNQPMNDFLKRLASLRDEHDRIPFPRYTPTITCIKPIYGTIPIIGEYGCGLEPLHGEMCFRKLNIENKTDEAHNDEIYNLYTSLPAYYFSKEDFSEQELNFQAQLCRKAVKDMEIKMQEWVERILNVVDTPWANLENMPEIHPSLGNSKNLIGVKRKTLYGQVSDKLFGNASNLQGKLNKELEGIIHKELSGDISDLEGMITNVCGNVTGVICLCDKNKLRTYPTHIFTILLWETFGGYKESFMDELVSIWKRRIYLKLKEPNLSVPAKVSYEDHFRNCVYNCRKTLEGELLKYGPSPVNYFTETLTSIEKEVFAKMDAGQTEHPFGINTQGKDEDKSNFVEVNMPSGCKIRFKLPNYAQLKEQAISRTQREKCVTESRRAGKSTRWLEELLDQETIKSWLQQGELPMKREAVTIKNELSDVVGHFVMLNSGEFDPSILKSLMSGGESNKADNSSISGMCEEGESKAHSSITEISRNATQENSKMTHAEIANIGLNVAAAIKENRQDIQDYRFRDIVFTDDQLTVAASFFSSNLLIVMTKHFGVWKLDYIKPILQKDEWIDSITRPLDGYLSVRINYRDKLSKILSLSRIIKPFSWVDKPKTSVDRYIEKIEAEDFCRDFIVTLPAAVMVSRFTKATLAAKESRHAPQPSFPPEDYGNDVEKDFNAWLKHTGFSFKPEELKLHCKQLTDIGTGNCPLFFYKNVKISPNGRTLILFSGYAASNDAQVLRYDEANANPYRVTDAFTLGIDRWVEVNSVFIGNKCLLVATSSPNERNVEAWYVGSHLGIGPVLKKPVGEDIGWVERLFNLLENN